MSTNFLRAQTAQNSETGSFAASSVSVQPERTIPRNQNAWLSIAEFLDAQFLAGFGLRRLAAAGERSEAATGTAPRGAHPVGNTGITFEASKNV